MDIKPCPNPECKFERRAEPSGLRELVEKWRIKGSVSVADINWLPRCADELEAALSVYFQENSRD